ncbi:MAG: hypothetical protein AB1585_20430 [Thermodesulfobacteriota bacterium]
MEAEKKTQTDKMTMKFKTRLTLNFKTIVAAVVGCCLMAAPLTRAYKQNCEQAV